MVLVIFRTVEYVRKESYVIIALLSIDPSKMIPTEQNEN